jgi:hypothetical protein
VTSPPQVIPAENALTVFTDGASLPGPRRGGVGIHFVHTDSVGNETSFDLDEQGYDGASNNQMELQAVITALRTIQSARFPDHMLDGITKIDVITDSGPETASRRPVSASEAPSRTGCCALQRPSGRSRRRSLAGADRPQASRP